MDTWTAMTLSRQAVGELRRDAARHRLGKLAAASGRDGSVSAGVDGSAAATRAGGRRVRRARPGTV